ncbi:MAG: hypothetical protein RLZZ166_1106 [Pseudomonadota bacterium]
MSYRSASQFLLNPQGRDPEFVSLFKSTFTKSEGPAEGDLIGGLVSALLADNPQDDIHIGAFSNPVLW